MPAIITHDTFGHDVYAKFYRFIGGSRDEAHAFLLGNQGPDPLFYAVANPRIAHLSRLGSTMHAERPSELLFAMRDAVRSLPAADRGIGRAYALGFLCHYELDSTAHPFIYAQQYALCDAGEPGLTRENGSDVHALIESELDELVLSVKRDATIASFNPAKLILKASDHVLDIISLMYESAARSVYDQALPAGAFKAAVKAFRLVQGLFYSPSGLKHNLIGRAEMLVRPYSFFRAMSHRNLRATTCAFDNHEHAAWENPFTGATETTSFFDLYERACNQASYKLALFDAPGVSLEVARALTHDLNFSGKPTAAQILAVEDVREQA